MITLVEIRQECRDLARDFQAEDYLWSDDEMNRYINRVYWRIATETRCIRDATTEEVCIINSAPVDYTTYAQGTLDYLWANDPNSWLYHQDVCPYVFPLHQSIIDIEEVKWVSRQWKLMKVSVNKWRPNPWWERVKGMPTEYCTDYKNKCLTVNFRDTATDNLSLSVRRAPLAKLVDDADAPEFRENYHEFFMNGVLYYMYSKQDSEAFDKEKAAEHYQLYLKDIDEIKQQESQLDAFLRPNYAMAAFL
jgi:hypothetical protein